MKKHVFYVQSVTITLVPVDAKGVVLLNVDTPPAGGGWKADLADENGASLAKIRPPKRARFFATEEEAYEKAETAMYSLFNNPVPDEMN